MRKLSKTLAMMGLLTPVGANALGVGEIKLHSALNQNLKADIPLITSASESVSGIRVNLASPSAFAKAGLDRPFYLSGLKFRTVTKGGRTYVRVTSREVIREPFLNFLVDVSWPQGRMLREFTVLLDPPVILDKKSITANTAPVVQSTTVTQPLYRVDEPSNYGFRARPVTTPQPVTSSQRSKKTVYNPGDQVTVRKNDTLWGIAKRINRGGSVSDEQMIVALYQSNPHAFFKKNMNSLKAGARLTVPEKETVSGNSKKQAIGEIKAQYDAWTGQVADSSGNSSNQSAVEQGVSKSGTETRSQLKLVAPSDKSKVTGETVGSAPGDKSNKADVAIEMAETVSQENEELRSRLHQIEQQLAMMQRLMALKDKQLSTLQARAKGDIAGQQSGAGEKIMDLAADDESGKPANVPNSTDLTSTPATKVDGGASKIQPSELTKLDTDAKNDVETAAVTADVKEAEKRVEPVSKPMVQQEKPQAVVEKPKPQPVVQDDDLLSGIFSEPLYLALGGGGIVLLGVIAWMMSRRKNSMDLAETERALAENEEEKEIDGPSARVATNTDQSSPAADISMVAESSFLSEFTPSDFDALETEHDEVDPVSEADVYLAYGRYQQAEDLIRSAIENYPEREECKLKLFEIHYATEDKAAFEAYAEELSFMKDDNPDFWSKVIEMGRELCPQNSLFSGVGPIASESLDDADVGTDETDPRESLEADPAAGSMEEPLQAMEMQDEFETGQTDEIDLGLDMGLGSSSADDDGMDFGLDGSSDDLEGVALDGDSSADSSLEFDASELETASLADEGSIVDSVSSDEPVTDGQSDSNDIDFTGGLDEPVDEMPVEAASNGDENTLEFDLDFSSTPIDMDGDDADSSSVSDFADSDEIETKLDLAKAYVEMDDQDSARDILTEILAEGNDEQKTEAQALVDVIENKA